MADALAMALEDQGATEGALWTYEDAAQSRLPDIAARPDQSTTPVPSSSRPRSSVGIFKLTTVTGRANPLTAAWVTVGLFRLQRRDALSRQRLLDELQDVQDELERRQRAAGALTERARIARDLHDTLAQELAGSRMLLQAAERDRIADPDRAWRHVHLVSEALGEHLAETRRIIDDLTPAELEDTSLETALRDLCERAQRDGAARRITFTGNGARPGPSARKPPRPCCVSPRGRWRTCGNTRRLRTF